MGLVVGGLGWGFLTGDDFPARVFAVGVAGVFVDDGVDGGAVGGPVDLSIGLAGDEGLFELHRVARAVEPWVSVRVVSRKGVLGGWDGGFTDVSVTGTNSVFIRLFSVPFTSRSIL